MPDASVKKLKRQRLPEISLAQTAIAEGEIFFNRKTPRCGVEFLKREYGDIRDHQQDGE